jgi:hypothetical protein
MSATNAIVNAAVNAPVATPATDWAYPDQGGTRDLRIDLMRGLVFVLLFTSHFEFMSAFMLVGWERIGVVSSAETFILLAGVVTGMVFGKKLIVGGFAACTEPLMARAMQLYKVYVVLILSIGLLRLLPWVDATVVTTFHNPYTGVTYPLYPSIESGLLYLLRQALLLRCGPHQFQVIGLYVVLFMLTPFIFWMIGKGRTRQLLTISWILYLISLGTPESTPGTAEIRLTGAQFEYGFPLVVWQLIFVHGVVIGYFKKPIVAWFAGPGRPIVWLSIAMSFVFMLFTLNHPLPLLPSWSTLSFVPPDTFNSLFNDYFLKYRLGPGRLLNEAVLCIAGYALLTRFWQPIHKAIGWFFIPLGQASLYVFIVHIYLLLLVSNTPLPGFDDYWVNTGIHAGALLLTWLMIRTQFLFRWIPR